MPEFKEDGTWDCELTCHGDEQGCECSCVQCLDKTKMRGEQCSCPLCPCEGTGWL